jgi:hypothetical protein
VASSQLSDLQFTYLEHDVGASKPLHKLVATRDDEEVGQMIWSPRSIRAINVPAEHQRQGVATALWHEGHRLAGEQRSIPRPAHSTERTRQGDAWAKSVGGRLPRRV